jgi:hypothetical protein
MGGAEVVFELNQLIDHAGWHRAWLQYCRLTQAPKQVVAGDMQSGNEGQDAVYAAPGRLAAYAYAQTKNATFAKKAWALRGPLASSQHFKGPDVLNPIDEIPGLSTNSVAQTCLQWIEILEMCGDQAPV